MDDGVRARRDRSVIAASVEQLHAATSRRAFLRLMALGGTLVLLPSVVTACADEQLTDVGTAGSGDTIVIDFAKGDVALLQFAYVLEQLEADFYSRVVAAFTGSNITAVEQTLLTDVRNHEVIHRDLLQNLLGADGGFTVRPIYGSLAFGDRAAVLARAKSFEDLGVSAYNGMAPLFANANNLSLVAKIVSVEGRHASTISSLLAPRTVNFAPNDTDPAIAPAGAATAAQSFIVQRLAFANEPVTPSPAAYNG